MCMQGEKGFTLDVPLNSQNSGVCEFDNKGNQINRLFHPTNRQSKKVMVSACNVEKCYDAVFYERQRFESHFQNI